MGLKILLSMKVNILLIFISLLSQSCSLVNVKIPHSTVDRKVSNLESSELSQKAKNIINDVIDNWELDDRLIVYKPNTSVKKRIPYCFWSTPRDSTHDPNTVLIDLLKYQGDMRANFKQIFYDAIIDTYGNHPEFVDLLLEKIKNSQPIKLKFQSLWANLPEKFYWAGVEHPHNPKEKVPYNQMISDLPSEDGCYHSKSAQRMRIIAHYLPRRTKSIIEFNLQHFGSSTKPKKTRMYDFLTATNVAEIHVEKKLSLLHEFFHHLDMDYLDKNASIDEKKKNGGVGHRKYVNVKLGRPLQKDAVFSCSHLVQKYEPQGVTFLAAEKLSPTEYNRRRVTYDSCMTCLTAAFRDISVDRQIAHNQCSQYPALKLN